MFVKCKMRSFFGTFPHSKQVVLKFWYLSALMQDYTVLLKYTNVIDLVVVHHRDQI